MTAIDVCYTHWFVSMDTAPMVAKRWKHVSLVTASEQYTAVQIRVAPSVKENNCRIINWPIHTIPRPFHAKRARVCQTVGS